jgi:hypothetical protein
MDRTPARYALAAALALSLCSAAGSRADQFSDFAKSMLQQPAAQSAHQVADDHWARARSLADWKARITSQWPNVRVTSVDADTSPAHEGDERGSRAVKRSGTLTGPAAAAAAAAAHQASGRRTPMMD